MQSVRGFTLIELLVVIAIMAIIGIFVLPNFRTFGEDQNLKSAALNLQSQLRTAQTNATSNVKCGNTPSTIWQVKADTSTIYLACPDLGSIKGVKLGNNIVVDAVSGNSTDCPPEKQFVIEFAPLSGRIDLGHINCTQLNITLKNTKNLDTKSIIIDQGGGIDIQ